MALAFPRFTVSRFPQILRLTAMLVVALLLVTSAFAQSAARIEGTVQDQSGAAVPGAKITALNNRTHESKEVKSNSLGLYVITPLQPGIYTVTAEASGFTKSAVTALEINVGAIVDNDFKLAVGSTTETVEVQANTVSVQTTDSQISRAVTMKDIDTLPQLNRTPIALAVMQPGIQLNPGDVSFSRINGQRQGSNNATLDGIDINDSVVPRLGLALTANNTDSVGEFKIVTEGGKAEYGRNAGGQVEMVTRSGSNKFHGNLFDYLRNTNLNANDYFNKQSGGKTPKFIQNIYGGSIGGPIIKDKTFFFGNFQGRRTRQETVRNRTVYTASARQGIFTYKDSTGALQTINFAANDPRHLGVDPKMAAIFALTPPSNNCDLGDGLNTCGFRFNNPSNSQEDQFTIKGDHNISDKNRVFLRWSWQTNSSIDSLNNADATFPGQVAGTQGGHRWGYSIGDDWTLSPTVVNEFRFGHQSATVAFNRPARLSGPSVITNLITDPISPNYAQGRNSPVDDYIDNVTKSWHSHIFKMGGKYSHTQQQGYNFAGVWQNVTTALANSNVPGLPAFPTGIFGTSTQQASVKTTYQQVYNDVLGRMDSIAQTFYSNDLATFQASGIPKNRNHILNESALYFQDDWRIRRNFTLNLGLRWELYMPPKEQNGIQANIKNASEITNPGIATDLTIQRSTNWYNTDWNNFAPRVGFAWDVTGDGKTAVRANYGVFFDRNAGATVSLADNNTPGFALGGLVTPQTLTAAQLTAAGCGAAPVGDVRVNDCVPLPAAPASPPLTLPVTNRSTSIVLFNPNLRTGYVHQYSLSIQREIIRNTILEVNYVGARGVKLFMDRDLNQMRIDEDFLGAFKEIQAYNANNLNLPSANNTLVKIFGTPANAVSKIGASNLTNGNVGAAANTVDRSFNSLYAAAGLPQTYLRSFPQFNQVIMGTNDGRSYYDALQISVRRNMSGLRLNANYTFSKSIDNISVDGNGFTTLIDNLRPALNKALGDFDHRNSFNASFSYALPFGNGKMVGSNMPKWLNALVGDWEIGSIILVQDGTLFTVNSQRTTRHLSGTGTTGTSTTWENYTGDTSGSAHYQPDGSVLWFTSAQIAAFSAPAAGEYGTSGRNGFRGPGYFDVDSSLVKRFKITESQAITFRAEAYNLLNKPNFLNPGTTITSSSFGRISGTTGPAGTSARNLQLTLRYDF